jgi:hypothetical protein
MQHLRSICILLLLALFIAGIAFSQAGNATLLGTVTDASGGVVPNAKVTITEAKTGVSYARQTNESGNYTVPDLSSGNYTVSVELSGFKKERRAGVVVEVNSSTRVDLQLQPGSVSESIEVTARTPLLQTDRADTAAKLDAVQADNFPIGSNRNYKSILTAVTGTSPATFQHSQFFNAASSLQTEVNGWP